MIEKPREAQESSNDDDTAQPPFSTLESLPMTPQGGIPAQEQAGAGQNNPGDASTIARELHWLEKLNIAGQMSLVIVGIVAVFIYGRQLGTMQGQLDQMSKQSLETQNQTTLMRQQVIGTQAAVIRTEVVFKPDNLISIVPGVTLQFLNNGKVSAENFAATVILQRVSVPDFKSIGSPKRITITKSRFPARGDGLSGQEAMAQAVFDTSDIGEATISRFKNMTSTLEITTHYSYGDGFGKEIKQDECSMFTYIVGRIPNENYDNWQDCDHAKNDYRSALKNYR